ncbi:MAG: hypothetical protein JXR73_17780, partial [Candidatus Omnitrophica bacterium]|nr:hypothetical protein [Candidatus Omnitrophota bacterium]
SLPKCDACGLPYHVRDMVNHKGEKLCRSCMQTALFCTLCGKRIQGKYYQSKDKTEQYCSHCYNKYPRCSVCDRPGPVHRLPNGKTVCDKCLKTLPRCGACGQPVIGAYFKYPGTDQVFCESCQINAFKCYSCGVPLGKKHWLFDDGRRICDACNNRAVYDIKKIQMIMQQVQKLCETRLRLTINTPYELIVKDLNKHSSEQAKQAKEGKSSESPLYGKELGLYRRMNGDSEIYLLYGLPIEMLYDTAAHEYAHAWQAENCVPHQSPELLEGFAQWVSAQILKIMGFDQALERLEARRDNPYGTGYHRVKAVEQKFGRTRMMEYIKKTQQ